MSPGVPVHLVGASPLPTRSEIEGLDTRFLWEAAERWSGQADESERIFERHLQNVRAPGGTEWVGRANDAAVERATTDLGVVRRQGEVLWQAAQIARDADDDLRAAKRLALEAISQAEADGLKVGEDLSVTDTRRRDLSAAAPRQRAVAEHADYIRWHAEQLAQARARRAGLLVAKAAELVGIRFEQSGQGSVQLVDFKQSPADADDNPNMTPEEILERYQVTEDPDGKVDWEPSWPASIFTEPAEITAGEARMLDDLGLPGQRDFGQIKEAAEAEAHSRFPGATGDNHNDAFRHAYWNALMTQRFGEEWTREFATRHERAPGNKSAMEAMDLWNNEIGRKIAAANPGASPEQLAGMVERAVHNGEMVVIRPDGHGLVWSDQIPVGGPTGDARESVPIPANGPGPEPIPRPRGGYDPGQPGGYGTTAGGY